MSVVDPFVESLALALPPMDSAEPQAASANVEAATAAIEIIVRFIMTP